MRPVEAFAPGEYLRDEIEVRGWTQDVLAEIMGRPTRLVNEIIAGKKSITPETAVQLGQALGTSPDFWMNLESQYQLSKVRIPNDAVARRAELYAKLPVKEMLKRGWVVTSESIEVLESNFINFFGGESLETLPTFSHAAKKTNPEAVTYAQLAWLYRARSLASTQVVVSPYDETRLRAALSQLQEMLLAPEESRNVPKLLASCGVRFVIVEALKGSKIDGACFWLSENSPVVAMSLRLDRIDNFWFVLRHEIEHVLLRHGRNRGFILDQDSDVETFGSIADEEAVANAAAGDFCVPSAELSSFIFRVKPFFSEERIKLFSEQLKRHPGIVVGQLHRALNDHKFLRKYQVKISPFIVESADVDGWGVKVLFRSS